MPLPGPGHGEAHAQKGKEQRRGALLPPGIGPRPVMGIQKDSAFRAAKLPHRRRVYLWSDFAGQNQGDASSSKAST